jgi:hypothetical protein
MTFALLELFPAGHSCFSGWFCVQVSPLIAGYEVMPCSAALHFDVAVQML